MPNMKRLALHYVAVPIALAGLGSLSRQWVAVAQSQTFEVASVKIHKGEGGTTRVVEPGGLRYLNITLGEFIIISYGVKRHQIAGPDWVVNSASSDRYDIVAKAGGTVPRDQVPRLIGPLLTERFKLQFHRETRVLPAYALTVLKGGPKFDKGNGGESSASPDGKGGISYKNYSMSALATALSLMPAVGHAVLERTGLSGKYNFALSLLDAPPEASIDESKTSPGADGDPVSSPILSNLQLQLGLKLQAVKAPIEMFIIDHIERTPTED